VTCRGLADAISAPLAECHLDGSVAIRFRGFDLSDAVVRNIDNGHRNGVAVLGEYTRHTDLTAD
jgi:hypothetical protein